jgi:hypothetical protein
MAGYKKGSKVKPLRGKSETPAEEIWIRAFVEFYATENITRVCREDLGGVSLTRAFEALTCGSVVASEKCDGPGVVCRLEHRSDDDFVAVVVYFEAGEMVLEIREAAVIEETDGETDAA